MIIGITEIEQQVIAEQLKEICRQLALSDDTVTYSPAMCSGFRQIRFKTQELSKIFGNEDDDSCFEIGNFPDQFSVSIIAIIPQRDETERALRGSFGSVERLTDRTGYALLRQNLMCTGNQAEVRPQALREWLSTDFVWLRKELRKLAADPSYHPRPFPIPAAETYTEGRPLTKESLAWERDPRARRKCIAIHGTACAVCGFDFGKIYGPEFADKIEVHHIHPLSEIREEHETDPVRDLVPVCPNCHRMLHSNPDGGVFSVEELKEMLNTKHRGNTGDSPFKGLSPLSPGQARRKV